MRASDLRGMMLKHLALAVLLAALVVVAIAPGAHADPLEECPIGALTQGHCQGPDGDPDASGCEIATWFGQARCELTVPGGISSFSVQGHVKPNELEQRLEAQIEIRDKATGQLLYGDDISETWPLGGNPVPAWSRSAGGTTNASDTVFCEIIGTNSVLWPVLTNTFSCSVS